MEPFESEIWGKKTFCLVTGASRGIGHEVAIKFARKFAPGSVLCLLARDGPLLEETKAEIEKTNPDISVFVTACDLGEQNFETFEEMIKKCFSEKCRPKHFEVALIVHNAGYIGTTDTKCIEHKDDKYLTKFFKDNFISAVVLNSAFFHQFFAHFTVIKVVVNIASLSGIEPIQYHGEYCAGKAARTMLFKVLAKEEPDILVLNYAPGLVRTRFLETALNSKQSFSRQIALGLEKAGLVLSCDQTVDKLIRLLEGRKFQSGKFLDYYADSEDENDATAVTYSGILPELQIQNV